MEKIKCFMGKEKFLLLNKSCLDKCKMYLNNDKDSEGIDSNILKHLTAGNYKNLDYDYLLDSITPQDDSIKLDKIDLNPEKKYFIIGDLHADLISFQEIIRKTEFIKNKMNTVLIFLGDYLDRGKDWNKLIEIILTLKFLLPENIQLIRGNHELSQEDENGYLTSPFVGANNFFNRFKAIIETTEKKDDLETAQNYKQIAGKFAKYFNSMPSALLCLYSDNINHEYFKILAVHGGLPRVNLMSKNFFVQDELSDLMNTKDSLGIDQDYNMLWSDPYDDDLKYFNTSSEIRFKYNIEHFKHFCKKYDIDMMFRAHEEQAQGFRSYYGDRLMSVFSTGGCNLNLNEVVNENSHYSKVSPNIFEIDLENKKIISWNISFDKNVGLDLNKDLEELYISFDKIKSERRKQEDILKDYIPKELKVYDEFIENKKTTCTIKDLNNSYQKYPFKLEDGKNNYQLTYEELKMFYGVSTDFILNINVEKKKITIQSTKLNIFKEVDINTKYIRLENGFGIELVFK